METKQYKSVNLIKENKALFNLKIGDKLINKGELIGDVILTESVQGSWDAINKVLIIKVKKEQVSEPKKKVGRPKGKIGKKKILSDAKIQAKLNQEVKPKNSNKNNNPTGKGGLGERPQDINRLGQPHKGETMRDILRDQMENTPNAKKAVAATAIELAVKKGDMRAIQFIFENMDGKLPETLTVIGQEELIEHNALLRKWLGGDK
jgi:hypothetical protein